MATFLGELYTVVQRCNLETVDNMLCDRLVSGINNDSIQKRLLAEWDKLTLTIKGCNIGSVISQPV